jgi:hypothetical protein
MAVGPGAFLHGFTSLSRYGRFRFTHETRFIFAVCCIIFMTRDFFKRSDLSDDYFVFRIRFMCAIMYDFL